MPLPGLIRKYAHNIIHCITEVLLDVPACSV